MSDARERRRQRARQSRSGMGAGEFLKRFRVPIVIILVAGAIISYNVVASENRTACPGHWHSTLDVHVNGQHVSFTQNPLYTHAGDGVGGQMPLRTHMHRGSDSVWHFEPARTDCIPYREALDYVDMDLTADRLVLDSDYHRQAGWGGTHVVDENSSLTIRIREWEGEWRDISASRLMGMQVPDGASVLVVYGPENGTDVETLQQSGVTRLPSNLSPAGTLAGLPWGAIAGTVIFASVAIAVWYSMAKKAW